MYKDHLSGQATDNALTDTLSCVSKAPKDFKIISITNRQICSNPLDQQIDKLCQLGIKDFILREKDLSPAEYKKLATQIAAVCKTNNANLVLHSFWEIGNELSSQHLLDKKIHCPLWLLERDHTHITSAGYQSIGCSCHSIFEAEKAIQLGATYITASHIYPTDCKKGLAPRGLTFLKEICDYVSSVKGDTFPVYALGGINTDGSQFAELKQAGAAGACLMSGLMKI